MNPFDTIHKFHLTLPTMRQWIERTLEENKNQAVSVIDLDFPRLKKVFPPDLLRKAKAVVVSGKLPFPPLGHMGLTEFEEMENGPRDGITYKDTFFLSHLNQKSESLHFHEIVHVVQWERLGVNDFLLAYGVGLMQFGYRDSPLEQMAYSLTEDFKKGTLPSNVIEAIQQGTDSIWGRVASMVSKA
jgi:hypothetical protein